MKDEPKWVCAIPEWYPRDLKRQLRRPPRQLNCRAIRANTEKKGECKNEMKIYCDHLFGNY